MKMNHNREKHGTCKEAIPIFCFNLFLYDLEYCFKFEMLYTTKYFVINRNISNISVMYIHNYQCLLKVERYNIMKDILHCIDHKS